MKGFYGISLHVTRDSCGSWANPNCFGGTLHLLTPIHYGCMVENFIEGLIRIQRCRILLMPKMIWGVSNVSRRIILESGRELWRLNFFFLWCSWFRRGLNIRILVYERWMLGFGCLETLMPRLGFLSAGFVMVGRERRVF
jgi:hypothetical protein